ncbi:MAG: response regulator [Chloroflexi bacterium]|nr:response regulator [Chloroflexota bacterium]
MIGQVVARGGSPPGANRFDLGDLRGEALGPMTLGLLLLAVGYGMALVASPREAPAAGWALLTGLFALAGLVYLAIPLGQALAGLILTTGLGLAVVAGVYLYPTYPVASAFALVVVLAGILLGWRGGFVVAGATSGAILALASGSDGALAPETATAALGLVWLGALLGWAGARPTQQALDWSWSSYLQALEKTEELKDRQGELSRLSKSLTEAYLRLEEINRELARAREVAEEARRLKAEFAANISHELRTPLNLIIGFSEMMAMAPHAYGSEPLPAPYRGDLNAIYRSARHLSTLIDDVLDLSSIEAGRMGLAKEWASLPGIVQEAVATVDVIFQARGLSLDVHCPDALPPVYVDRTRIRQILINLLNNAARFTDHGGVTIEVDGDGEQAHIAVADTGVGIPEAELPHVFDEFRQVNDPAGRHYEGSGLGLTISKRFAILHGGSMSVESAVGVGTTFHLSLPVWDPSPVSGLPVAWPVPTRPVASTGRTVAVLDGEPDQLKLFQRYLDGFGVEAASGVPSRPAEALVVTASGWQEGWQKLQRVRELPHNLPLAVCLLPDLQGICRRLGVAEYLVKPVSRESLLASLGRLGGNVRRILVVDDDPEMVRLLARMIGSAAKRYRVWKAYGGREALELLRERRPDAIILDLLMPDVDGYTVLEQIRSEDELRGVPVIAVTARGADRETVVANALLVTTNQGLSVGQMMACLRVSLDALKTAPPPDSAPAPREAFAG